MRLCIAHRLSCYQWLRTFLLLYTPGKKYKSMEIILKSEYKGILFLPRKQLWKPAQHPLALLAKFSIFDISILSSVAHCTISQFYFFFYFLLCPQSKNPFAAIQSIKCSEMQAPLDINSIHFLTVTDSAVRSAVLTSDLTASCELNSCLPFRHL